MELVSIAASDGSTPPRGRGHDGGVPGGGITGTIGGGNVEFSASLAAEPLERGGRRPAAVPLYPWETPPAWAWSAAGGVTVQFQYLPAGEQKIIAVLRI